MSILLILAFLFFIGSVLGWVLELLYRRFFSAANPQRRWINPGFCTGPYLPIYGFGLCTLYLLACTEKLIPGISKALLFAVMAVSMTAIEYTAGIYCLKYAKVRLWDYSNEWANLQGIICPKFSAAWALLGAGYYFLVHPHILNALEWLAQNLAFSFFIGMFFGVFIIDFAHSAKLISILKKFADENNVVLRYEAIKLHIRAEHDIRLQKYHFFRPFHSDKAIVSHLRQMLLLAEASAQRSKKQ